MVTYSKLEEMGRLGNQLFQIASTIGIAIKNNHEFVFKPWSYSSYFKNPLPVGIIQGQEIKEQTFHYSDITFSEGNYDLFGYFQSEKYFAHCKDTILGYLDFKDEIIGNEQLNKIRDCSIHVRRGDYLRLKDYHPVQTMQYYNAAISYMENKGIKTFSIFSDDMPWCKQNFRGHKFTFVEGNNETQDLCLMSKCPNQIIGNSSFSWWGAWLNRNNNKTVIAPKNWFGSAYANYNLEDLYCTGWIRI